MLASSRSTTSVLSGLLTAFAFSRGDRGLLCLVSLIPLMWGLLGGGKPVASVFCFAFSYHLVVLSWLFELYPLVDYGIGAVASMILLTLAIIFVALGVSGLLTLPFLVFKGYNFNGVIGVIEFSCLYITGEFLIESIGFLSFPWGRLGTILHHYPILIQPAGVVGAIGMSFFILMVNGLAALFLMRLKGKEKVLTTLLGIALLLCGNLLWGTLGLAAAPDSAPFVPVGIVQGGLPSRDKWEAGVSETLERYLLLSEEGAKGGAKLLIWPETAVPTQLLDNMSAVKCLREFTSDNGITLVTGAFDGQEGRVYNGLFAIAPNGEIGQASYKRRLVPMGEFLPLHSLISKVFPQAQVGMTAGTEAIPLDTEFGTVGGLICYESIFPRLSRELVGKGARVLVVASNDSWFGDSAALEQHQAHSIMRAVENKRWLLRAGNTGLSSIIDPCGRIITAAPPFEPAVILGGAQMISGHSIYNICGDVVVLPGVLLIIYRVVTRVKKGEIDE